MRKVNLLLLLLLLSPVAAYANVPAQGWCESGNQQVTLAGLKSTSKVQASFPQCTVTVNIHGGGQATIFRDNSGTVLGNPFTATLGGQWQFYAANGRYDVVLSGAGYPASVTYADLILYDPSGALGTLPACVVSFVANPAFNASACSSFTMTMTANVTSSSVINGSVGQIISFSLNQTGGPWTFAWPANFVNPPLMTPVLGKSMQAMFTLLNDGNWHALSVGESMVFDTAVNGNVLRIAGVTVSGATGTGSAVLATAPTITNPTITGGGSLSGTFSGSPILTLNSSSVVPVAALNGIVPTTSGGTGIATAPGAAGTVLRSNGSVWTVNSLQSADIPANAANTSGNAANVTGTVAVANGGTGKTTITTNGILFGNGTSPLGVTAAGGAGTLCLQEINGAAPVWGACTGVASTLWSSLSSATANLSINNGSFTTSISGTGTFTIGGALVPSAGIGIQNTYVGAIAGNAGSSTGNQNTAFGYAALATLSSGTNNTAIGISALQTSTTGFQNTAVGSNALIADTTGNANTAVGFQALQSVTTGVNDVAVGGGTLQGITTGSSNIALGLSAGSNLTLADGSNIEIGNAGIAGDSGIIRIGSGAQTATHLVGTIDLGSGVLADSAGYKHKRFGATTATAATAFSTQGTAYLWTTAFANANYTLVCTGLGATNIPVIVGTSAKAAAGFTITVAALTNAAASYSEMDCEATHD